MVCSLAPTLAGLQELPTAAHRAGPSVRVDQGLASSGGARKDAESPPGVPSPRRGLVWSAPGQTPGGFTGKHGSKCWAPTSGSRHQLISLPVN